MQARDIMETDVKTVRADMDVADVFAKFARVEFSGFPVVDDDGFVVGVVTESDLVDLFEPADETLWIPIGFPPFVDTLSYQIKKPWDDIDLGVDMIRNADRKIDEVMTTDVVTVEPNASIDVILDILSTDDPNVNRIPVVDADGRLEGIIARQDVIRALRAERAS